MKISINELAKKYQSLQGQYIETEGTFYSGFEEFAIYTDKSFLSNNTAGFWLELDPGFIIKDSSFQKMQGKKNSGNRKN